MTAISFSPTVLFLLGHPLFGKTQGSEKEVEY